MGLENREVSSNVHKISLKNLKYEWLFMMKEREKMAHTAQEAIKKEQAIFENTIVAESDHCQYLEEDSYFPPGSVKMEYLKQSGNTEDAGWKGEAHFFDVIVKGKVAKDTAWHFPQPLPGMEHLKGYIAFRGEVKVSQWKRSI